MKYEITKNLEVIIYFTEENRLFQPTWPNGDAWESKAQAEEWAKAYIAAASGEDVYVKDSVDDSREAYEARLAVIAEAKKLQEAQEAEGIALASAAEETPAE